MDEWAVTLNDRIIKRFRIEEGQTLTIGRDSEADIVIDNTAISRQHCSLELKGGTYYLTDLYSLNGTKVNGKKVISAIPIRKTDLIEISKFTLQPMETILAEQTAESYAIPSNNGMDQTVFVTSKPEQQTVPSGHGLKVISGKADPEKLDFTGKNSVKVGKDDSCDMIISGLFIGKTHFFLTRKKDLFTLIPLGSIRKIYINKKAVQKETKLKKGDEIKTAGVVFKFE